MLDSDMMPGPGSNYHGTPASFLGRTVVEPFSAPAFVKQDIHHSTQSHMNRVQGAQD